MSSISITLSILIFIIFILNFIILPEATIVTSSNVLQLGIFIFVYPDPLAVGTDVYTTVYNTHQWEVWGEGNIDKGSMIR